MTLLIVSFIAGVLTVLAPCILPLLPVILGGTVTDTKNKRRPLIIIGSLVVSVFVFTLLLKGSTALINASTSFWSYVSAVILLAFGLTLLFPVAWAKLLLKIPGHNKPDAWLNKGYQKGGSLGADILVGAALGPVFTTCSPTFFVILATVLPQSLAMGIIDLLAYIIGLALALLLIAWIGQKLVDKLEWAADPNGWFKKLVGVLFIILAVLIAFGFDKKIETDILNSGFFDVTTVEQSIHQALEKPTTYSVTSSSTDIEGGVQSGLATSTSSTKSVVAAHPNYIEIKDPAGFVNSAQFKLADIVGKKVILIDFVDYTCINCQRTFPYLNDWYSKYKDQGLEIVAIHTPEFSFEKDIANVTAAAQQFGLKFPIVLDNDYATWNAYKNEYWPHKYLIDIHGNIIYDHIGEGGYDETEQKIVAALNERKKALSEPGTIVLGKTLPEQAIQTQSPETYFGALRNEYFGNGTPQTVGEGVFTIPDNKDISPNTFYLGGDWKVDKEYAETGKSGAELSYYFNASKMYIIVETADGQPATAQVLIDGQPITAAESGDDVKGGQLMISGSRLYNLFKSPTMSPHRIDIIFSRPGIRAYTFTFG